MRDKTKKKEFVDTITINGTALTGTAGVRTSGNDDFSVADEVNWLLDEERRARGDDGA